LAHHLERDLVVAKSGRYRRSRLNAVCHGLTAQHVVLPWEDTEKYQTLLEELMAEYDPLGPTERHLVEQLAALFWRQQRVLQAEAASIRDGLRGQLALDAQLRVGAGALAHLPRADAYGPAELFPVTNDAAVAVRMTEQESRAQLAELEAEEARLWRALRILGRGGLRTYERALRALPEDVRDSWAEELEEATEAEPPAPEVGEDDAPVQATAASLRQFIEVHLLPNIARKRQEIEHRPLIRAHALAMAVTTTEFDRIDRHEVHLTRQIQRVLAMLLRLQETRKTIKSAAA
jgi:hypothetical protein